MSAVSSIKFTCGFGAKEFNGVKAEDFILHMPTGSGLLFNAIFNGQTTGVEYTETLKLVAGELSTTNFQIDKNTHKRLSNRMILAGFDETTHDVLQTIINYLFGNEDAAQDLMVLVTGELSIGTLPETAKRIKTLGLYYMDLV